MIKTSVLISIGISLLVSNTFIYDRLIKIERRIPVEKIKQAGEPEIKYFKYPLIEGTRVDEWPVIWYAIPITLKPLTDYRTVIDKIAGKEYERGYFLQIIRDRYGFTKDVRILYSLDSYGREYVENFLGSNLSRNP